MRRSFLTTTLAFVIAAFLAAYVYSRLKTAEPITVSIVPAESGPKGDAWISPHMPFYVVVANRSAAPVSVWRESCSWGYFALTFELKTSQGTISRIEKKMIGWDADFPAPFIIPPHGYFVLPVNLEKDWQNYPTSQQEVSIRAHYKIAVDDQSQKERVWSGEIVSPWESVTVSK